MASLVDSYTSWLLIIIHVFLIVEIIVLAICKSKFHKQVFDLSPSLDNNKNTTITESNEDIYIKFPANSGKVFLSVLKKNHLFLKPYYRDMLQKDLILETISKNIILIGVLGISGKIFKASSSINTVLAGLVAGFTARLIHFLYSSLQAKQELLHINLSSEDKLVVNVETEVMRRLNLHRTMRRVLGYFIMFLYYIANIYYSINYAVFFNTNISLLWFLAVLFGIGLIIFLLEPLRIFLQIEAINYLRSGGSKSTEAICKMLASEEILNTFD